MSLSQSSPEAPTPGAPTPTLPLGRSANESKAVARPGVGQAPAAQGNDNVIELYPGVSRLQRRRRGIRLMGSEAGMATAEYAITTLAAVGFAGLLVFILRSDEVRGFLLNLIRTALALP
ncbi:DUF4244 domain-containing protein [Arthrobacter sp. D1-29]